MNIKDLENLNKQFEITKITKLLETNNDMEHHFYYLVYLKLINKEQTRCRRLKFVIDFDAFDLQDYFEQDYYTSENIKTYKNEIASNMVYTYLQDDIFNKYQDILDYANETIKNYNKIARYY